ncbi:hypothetical protein LMK19_000610 [Listeria monocytogenes]|nr:hypothetical protein [Listeria monocytogenes]EIL9237271.1 hypothetical protein [Listeria monocytogenes]
MSKIEPYLVKNIAHRFRKIRVTKHKNIPPDLISNGQKSAILRIEKGKIPSSGNFISDTLLEDYVHYFKCTKVELIFGNDLEIETLLYLLFHDIFTTVVPENIQQKFPYLRTRYPTEEKVTTAFIQLPYAFADFSRWNLLLKEKKVDETQDNPPVDFASILWILWAMMKEKMIYSFKEKYLPTIFNTSNQKFQFNQIDHKLQLWLKSEFSDSLIPDLVTKLQNNSIFKLGYMVKQLINDFLINALIECYLEDIPLKEYIPPIQKIEVNSKKLNKFLKNQKNHDKFNTEWDRYFSQKQTELTSEDFERMESETFFQGMNGITYKTTPFINETNKVSVKDFLDYILRNQKFFSHWHVLNINEHKIPGILTVNSHAANLLQQKISTTLRATIDEYVGYQNILINCIKWNELSELGK